MADVIRNEREVLEYDRYALLHTVRPSTMSSAFECEKNAEERVCSDLRIWLVQLQRRQKSQGNCTPSESVAGHRLVVLRYVYRRVQRACICRGDLFSVRSSLPINRPIMMDDTTSIFKLWSSPWFIFPISSLVLNSKDLQI